MNVSELIALTNWIKLQIVEANIPQHYQALFQVLQVNVQPNQPKQPFETQKDQLIQVLRAVPLHELTKEQLIFLDYLAISDAVGNEGVAAVEDILFKNAIDIASAATKIQQLHQQVSNGIAKSDQIHTALSDYPADEEYELHNAVLMRVGFKGNAQLKDVVDFKTWGNAWFDIGRGIAMAHNASPEDVRIIGATKGSIILELLVAHKIAITTSGIILAALAVADKVMDIRKKAEEVRGLKLNNDKIAKELEEAAEKEKEEGIDAIGKEIVAKLGINPKNEGDKVKFLENAVKHLVGFVEEGGDVDFILPRDTEESEHSQNNRELRIAFEEIRRIEHKLTLIEHKREN